MKMSPRLSVVFLALALVAGSCTSDTNIEAAATTTSSAAVALPGTSLEDVSGQIIDAWGQYKTGPESARLAFAKDQLDGASEFEATQNLNRLDVVNLNTTLEALPMSVDEMDIDAPLQDVRRHLKQMVEVLEEMIAVGDADPAAAEAALGEDFSEDQPLPDYLDLLFQHEDLFIGLSDSCFGLQMAMTDAGVGLLDCTGSSVDQDKVQDEALSDVDPTKERTGFAFARIESGVYDFEIFGPGLTLDIASPIHVRTGPESVEFQPVDEFNPTVTVWAMERAAVPGTLHVDAAQMSFAPMPDDVAGWIGELPLTLLGTGELQLGPDTGKYWDVEIDEERLPAELQWPSFLTLSIFDGEPSDNIFGSVGFPPVPGSSLRLIEWQRSIQGDRMFLSWWNDTTLDVPAAETFLQEVLAGAS